MQEDQPFDGVIPSEYPQTYQAILNSQCVKQRPEFDILYAGRRSNILLCNHCYSPYVFAREERVTIIRNLHAIGKIHAHIPRCKNCHRELLIARPIIECGKCTEKLI